MNEIYVRATIYCSTDKETFNEAWDELALKLARIMDEDKSLEFYIDSDGELRNDDGTTTINGKRF